MPDEILDEKKITPKEAAEAASKFYREATGEYSHVSLEEVEFKEGYWYVTLGIERNALIYGQKDYKIFKVNAKTAYVESMTVKSVR
ncbi:MAG TPA: hypothetical protein VJH95_03200 [Candidatus Nanoarchaeia archaeon]|nr:hypothetical protein [Candidatus Nanoarchaeia archaeon]